jgi:cytochrome oxidase Cu insertion factor (SCO1/SenC/PrrC family)
MPKAQRAALFALFFLGVVTVGWWALALWPNAGPTPEWLSRARFVCFNAGPDGMPDASGWLLLIGQPIGMFAVLMVVWGGEVRAALHALFMRVWGRVVLASCILSLLAGLAVAATRVVDATAAQSALSEAAPLPDTYPRLDREAPALALVDQRGERLDLEDLSGRPTLVTFAFVNCQTVCPAMVREALDARERLRSLDPWRDTPTRLSHAAAHWKLGDEDHVLSGEVEEVEDVLTRWNVARRRDPRTGDVVHPPLVYVLDGSGRIAFASTGGTQALVELLGRL